VLAILIILFIMLFKKKRGATVIMLVSTIILGIVGLLLYNTVFYNNSDRVTITDGYDKDFSINVKNHLIQYEYTYAQFSSDLSFNEIQDILNSQYKIAFFDEEFNQFVFIDNNLIFTIEYYGHSNFLWSDRYEYMFSSNTVGIEENSERIEVPFPRHVVDNSEVFYGSEMNLNCDYEKVKSYYTSFTNAEFGENTIILTYDNYKVELIFKDNFVKINIIKD
nr:hypothetical protein [Lachnospiraceae bacterium]